MKKAIVKSAEDFLVFGHVANHMLHRNHAHANNIPGCLSVSSSALLISVQLYLHTQKIVIITNLLIFVEYRKIGITPHTK